MQRYFSTKKEDDYFYLEENDLYHIKTVMRMQKQDLVEIVYNNSVYICSLEYCDKIIKFKIIKRVENSTNNLPYVTLIIPYLKENKIDLILQKGTEMGVSEFILCPMTRSVVKIESKKLDGKLSRWKKICKEASEQSKRVNIPNLKIVDNIKDLESLDGICLTCSTQEKVKTIKNVLKSHENCDRINLVIGPEGGLTDEEESILEQIHFTKITLGNMIMRVESVPLFLMSVINYEYME